MPERAEILQAIKEELSSRGIDESKITPEANLQKDLGLDSLDAVEMATSLEERFGVEIPDEELEKVDTVDATVNLISSNVGVG